MDNNSRNPTILQYKPAKLRKHLSTQSEQATHRVNIMHPHPAETLIRHPTNSCPPSETKIIIFAPFLFVWRRT